MAGYFADAVHECHGSIHHLQCLEGCSDAIWPADDFVPDVDETGTAACAMHPAAAPTAVAWRGPTSLMFNDWDWLEARTAASTTPAALAAGRCAARW